MNEIVKDIISNITGFISYVAPGYMFLSCYCYASCLEREEKQEYLIIKCVSISYILVVISQLIGNIFKLSTLHVQFISFALAIIIGFIIGRLHRSSLTNQISLKFLNREVSNNIFLDLWERANSKGAVVYVVLTLKENKGIFEGQIAKIISYNKKPALQLAYYRIFDTNNNLIFDNSHIKTAEVVIQYSNIEHFEYDFVSIKGTSEG